MARKQPALTNRRTKEEKEWEARDALNTLKRAEEIQANRSLMNRVKAQAEKDFRSAQKVVRKFK